MNDTFLIEGGKPLFGEVTVSGAKNVALKTIIAALLFSSEVELHNIPRIRDVLELLHLLNLLGAKAEFVGENIVRVNSSSLSHHTVDFIRGSKIRTSFLLFAPLLYTFGRADIPNPGGCRIGARPIDRIVNGMKCIGVEVSYNHSTGYYSAVLSGRPKGKYSFEKPSHTGTEFMILLSVFCEGSVCIENAAQEPEIDDLINMLNEGGAHIRREGQNIFVKGVQKLSQKKPFTIIGDRNEAITYAVLGIASGGSITVKGSHKEQLKTFLHELDVVGASYKIENTLSLQFFKNKELTASSIETTPHPGFMTDWQPNWAVLMTQAKGVSRIHERVFENRFSYVSELQKLGARIEFEMPIIQDPQSFYYFNYDQSKEYKQAIKITGPQKLHNGVLTVADLRAGATLAIAALLAPGESAVNNISILERGYERFVEKIRKLGGVIKKI